MLISSDSMSPLVLEEVDESPKFLHRSRQIGLVAAAGMTVLSHARSVTAAPANERIALAVVGVRGRGNTLASAFAQRTDCRVAYLCDVDSGLFPSRSRTLAEMQQGRAPQCVQDFRSALDDKAVDAVVIATPDHWHCLAGVWACQAGKDVYVESPLSQNAWEGRKLVEIGPPRRSGSSRPATPAAAPPTPPARRSTSTTGSWARSISAALSIKRGRAIFPPSPTARRPRASIGTCGTVRRRWPATT